MFTGIVQFMGQVRRFVRGGVIAQLEVATEGDISDLSLGDSMAVNGVCLTVVDLAPHTFRVEVSTETLERSTLGSLQGGRRSIWRRPYVCRIFSAGTLSWDTWTG